MDFNSNFRNQYASHMDQMTVPHILFVCNTVKSVAIDSVGTTAHIKRAEKANTSRGEMCLPEICGSCLYMH